MWFGVLRTFCYSLPLLLGAEESEEPQYYENCLLVLYYPFVRSTYLASRILYTYKCEVVRLHATTEYKGSRGTAPLGLNLGARWGEWSPSHSGRFNSWKETRHPLYTRLDGPQTRSGRFGEEKTLPYARIWTPYSPAFSLVTVPTAVCMQLILILLLLG
jgi:hypothetical protein